MLVLINKLQFELNQKEEAIKFKEKSLKACNQDIKKLRKSVLDLKESINIYEEKNLSLQSQMRAKDDIIKRLESKIKGFQNTKSIAVQMQIGNSDELQRLNTLEDYAFQQDSPIRNKKHSSRSNESMQHREKPLSRAKSKANKKTPIQKLTGLSYDSLLAMSITQAKEIEKGLRHSESMSYDDWNNRSVIDTSRSSHTDSILKENRIILNRKQEPETRFDHVDAGTVTKIIKYFQRGEDLKASELWKDLSYCSLPFENKQSCWIN